MKRSFFKKYSILQGFQITLFLLLLLKALGCQKERRDRYKVPLEGQIESQRITKDLKIKPRWLYLSQDLKALYPKDSGDEPRDYPRGDIEMTKLKKNLAALTGVLAELLKAFRTREIQRIQKWVHPQKGLYIDLKAHWSYKRLVKEIRSQRGYLYEVLLSKENSLSLYNTLALNSQIELDYYLKESACELKLHLTQRPEDSYLLNNPIFIYKGEQWYVYRLF